MKPRTRWQWWLICLVAGTMMLALLGLIPVGAKDLRMVPGSFVKVMTMDLSGFSSAPPGQSFDLLFIHHSVGGEWLAQSGPDVGQNCINVTHTNGGGLRHRLEQQGYIVHEASYGSRIGERTDAFDWLPKFRDQMPQILACDRQDTPLASPRRNQIVLFKSCFPNSDFTGPGQPPGDPNGPELTLANAQASYRALLPEFQKYPGVLFVCITTPPLAPKIPADPLWKAVARKVLGKPDRERKLLSSSALARQFANWLKAENGWLRDYPLHNVATFDYFDVLTGASGSDLLKYPTGDGYDSHPNADGHSRATEAFVPFLNQAVRRAGLVK
jgi:hypothetical protein